MTNPSAGDTVKSTNPKYTTHGDRSTSVDRTGMDSQCTRKRRRLEPPSTRTEIPEKTQRRDDAKALSPQTSYLISSGNPVSADTCDDAQRSRQEGNASQDEKLSRTSDDRGNNERGKSEASQDAFARETRDLQGEREPWTQNTKRKMPEESQTASAGQQDVTLRRGTPGPVTGRDESARLRKTIQWLEEGARRMREDLASVRGELHEERRAAKILKRETETIVREARAAEAAKYQMIIAELKTRGSRHGQVEVTCRTPSPLASSTVKADLVKDENHRREVSILKKQLTDANNTIRQLKSGTAVLQGRNSKTGGTSSVEVRRLETEIRNLRRSNEKLEEKLRITQEAEKVRRAELKFQQKTYEAELAELRKSFRSETVKLMDALREKDREIEMILKLRRADECGDCRQPTSDEHFETNAMRKLRENDKNGPIRSIPRSEKKYLISDTHAVDSYIREIGCNRAVSEIEVERLRELALEQQEIIEILRQALKSNLQAQLLCTKERERKLEQLSNKRRKEEFYRRWLELEPVAEVEDEEDHEEGDSALSSAPSSLSPQPGGCGQWQNNGVTREAYEALLIEVEELQSKLLDERQEHSHAKSQVRDLEKALLQETRCATRNKEYNTLCEKLRMTEEREATLLVELSELREQNELLEFRLLELEEMPARRDSPDHTADSGIVSPEPIHDQSSKHKNRAVATVIPYTTNVSMSSARPTSPIHRKPPLSLQESGIFEDDENEDEDLEVEFASRSTQTDVPAGELLQEVQRLQELRARLQERAAKVAPTICPIEPSKSCSTLDVMNDVSVHSIVQLSSYQERIRELEERLKAYEERVEKFEETERKQIEDKRLSKQREEELLDENYRLTERVYWLENELRNIVETRKESEKSLSEERLKESKEMSNTRKHEMREEELLKADVGVMTDYERLCSTKSVQTFMDFLAESSLVEHSRCEDDVTVEKKNGFGCLPVSRPQQRVLVDPFHGSCQEGVEQSSGMIKQRRKDEAEEMEVMKDVVDGVRRRSVPGTVSQILLVPETERPTADSTDSSVTLAESESEKKVRYRQSTCIEREGWAMRRWRRSRSERIRRDTRFEQLERRLVLYQEICV